MMTEAEKEEKERLKREKIRKFESPIPFVIILRNWIFGKKRPDIFTRLTFYTNLFIWFVFLIWSGFGYFAVVSRDWIWQQKGIPVTTIIEQRGIQLGFTDGTFLGKLEFAYLISFLCWGVFFVGLVLLYRKKKLFTYFTLFPIGIYLILNGLYLSFDHFLEDITWFDKILLLVSVVSLIIMAFMIKSERDGGSMNFFGVDQDAEVEESM